MEETKIQQILDELRQAHPMYDISALPTKQRGNKQLIVVKGFKNEGNIDSWSISIIYPLQWDMWNILEKNEGATGSLRLLFIRENQFVFYSPDTGCGNVFEEMKKPLHVDVYGGYEHQHYIGECLDINDILEYLSTTQIWF